MVYEHDHTETVPPHFQTRHIEDLFLFPVHHKNDKERQRQYRNGQQTHDIKPPCHGEEDAGYAGEVVGAMVKPIPVAILLRVYRLRAPFFSHTHPLSGKRCLPP